jgi:hypothetical protein
LLKTREMTRHGYRLGPVNRANSHFRDFLLWIQGLAEIVINRHAEVNSPIPSVHAGFGHIVNVRMVCGGIDRFDRRGFRLF